MLRVSIVALWMCLAPVKKDEPGIELPDPPAEPEPEPVDDEPAQAPSDEAEPEDFIEQPAPPSGHEHQRNLKHFPPILGPTMLSALIAGGSKSFGVSVRAVRFVVPWVGFGFDIDEGLVFEKPAYNDFAVAGTVWLIMTPHLRASPYLRGGLGGEFFSNRLGAYGRWKAGLGLVVRLDTVQRFAFGLGVEILGRFPDSRYERNLTCTLTTTPCSLEIRPEIGLSLHFG